MTKGALACILLAACGTRRAPEFAQEYQQARALLNDGDYESALERSRLGSDTAHREKSVEWTSAFEVLHGEALAGLDKSEAAVAALSAIQVPGSRPDVQARRNATLAMEVCILASDGAAENAAREFSRADTLLEEAARAAEQATPEVQAEVEIRRGSCFIDKGQLAAAQDTVRHALDIARLHGLRYLEGSAQVGLAYISGRRGSFEEGAAYSRDALAIAREIGSDRLLVKSLGNLGWCYTNVGDYDAALDYLKQAGSVAPKRQFRDDVRILFLNTGNIYYELKDFTSAVDYYQRALKLARELRNKRAIALITANLGSAALQQDDIAPAEDFNEEALRLKREIGDVKSVRRSELLRARILWQKGEAAESEAEFRRLTQDDSPDDVRWEAHKGLATIHWSRKQDREAEREFRAAIDLVETSRDALKHDESKITFLSSLSELYDSYIRFLAGNGRSRDALAVADRSHAMTLARRAEQADPQPRGASRDTQSVARAMHAVLLSYWLAPGGSYLWVSTGSRVEQFSLPPQKEIEDQVEAYQKIVERPRDALRDAENQGVALWRMLIEPARKLIPQDSNVIIVPDRGLHRLGFETLIVPSPIPHFWIEDVTIAEAPSLGSLALFPPRAERNSILLIGDPVQADPAFPRLSNAAAEIAGIANLYPARDYVVLTGAAATPAAYLEADPGRYRYIHFAAHASANRISPLDSAVVLARSGEDHKLYAREVLRIPLHADLVTISACRSAGARAYAGEGLVGFAWAFLAAGARNVAAGLWQVEDASTAQLMVQLHRELRLGRAPAEALRSSKLALLHSGTAYRRPFYWAPFLLYTRGN
jgi:CHAT domain-containing protein